MMTQWQKALTAPEPTFAAEAKKDKASWNDGLMNFGIAFAISAVVGGVYGMIAAPKGMALLAGGASLFMIPVSFVISMVLSVVVVFIYHFLAGALGGKGKVEKTYYMLSMFGAPIAILSLVAYIPCLGSIAALALMIYNAYLLTLCLKAAYGLDTMKAVITWLVPFIAFVIVIVAIGVLFAASVLGALASGIPGAGAIY